MAITYRLHFVHTSKRTRQMLDWQRLHATVARRKVSADAKRQIGLDRAAASSKETPPIRRVTLTFLAIGLAGGALSTEASAETASPESPTQEIAVEGAEEAAEVAEEADAASFGAALAAAPPAYARRIAFLAGRIARLRELIQQTHAQLQEVRELPHSTKRWREHRPRKRELLKKWRARVRELRARHKAAIEAAAAAQAGA